MSEAAAGSSWARRWRTCYDVLVGVVLFLALLVPALRQAGTGTLAGLRNGALLLLLDLVVLVMLSRYMTRPERHHFGRPYAPPAPPAATSAAVLSLEEAARLLDQDGAPGPDLGLAFTDTDIVVRQGSEPTAPVSRLAWSDCAAVVHSRQVIPGGAAFSYLQFVARHEDRIHRPLELPVGPGLAALLGLTATAAAMVWAVPDQLRHVPPLVLGYVERHHPDIRIVRPDDACASADVVVDD